MSIVQRIPQSGSIFGKANAQGIVIADPTWYLFLYNLSLVAQTQSINQFLYGTVAPTAGIGADGDFYIDMTTYYLYGPKASGTWPAGVSLVGPAGTNGTNGTNGTDGNTVLYGVVAPTTEGVDGNFYIDTVTNYLYGPKASGAWPAGTSLIGPTGPAGTPATPGAAAYGEMQGTSTTVTMTTVNTDYQVGGWSAASLNGWTYSSNSLVAVTPGPYNINCVVSVQNSSGNNTLQFTIYKNGVATSAKAQIRLSVSSDIGPLTISNIDDAIVATDVLTLWVQNQTASGTTVTITDANLSVSAIAGAPGPAVGSYFTPVAWDGVNDRVLGVGQITQDSFTSATSMPLHIACGDGQVYEMEIVGTSADGAAGANPILLPNNTAPATNSFERVGLYAATAGALTNALTAASADGGFLLCNGGTNVVSGKYTLITTTGRKTVIIKSYGSSTSSVYYLDLVHTWNDTTTVWSSLGTITMPNAWTGQIVCKRIA